MENTSTPKINIKSVFSGLRTLRKAGIGIKQICRLINWPEAKKLADESGIAWIKIAVNILNILCSLAPEKQLLVEEIVDNIDESIV